MATAEGLLHSLEQLVWLLCETAREQPLRFFLSLIIPLALLGILFVRIHHPRIGTRITISQPDSQTDRQTG